VNVCITELCSDKLVSLFITRAQINWFLCHLHLWLQFVPNGLVVSPKVSFKGVWGVVTFVSLLGSRLSSLSREVLLTIHASVPK